ncbi:MAG TPA: TolC family protein [Gemmatimonadaceae bacterium]|nr:TolC family protein [Gemmatimonadaceae bacterium]
MRVFNGKLAALTLALMMVCGTGRSLMAEGAPADTVSAGTPITFEDAVQIALKQNITLAQAQNAVASDAASVRGAKLSFLPNLQLSTSGSQVYGRNFDETTGDVLNRNNQSLNAGISSSITLFNGLQNVATLHEAQKNQDAGELDLTRAKQTTVFTVASNYLSIITAQEQLKVQQQNLASLQAQEDEIKKMVSAGARAISDLYSQQASTAAARLAVVNAQHDLELGKVDLVQTLRLDPEVTYNFIAPTVNDTASTQYNLDSLTARAYTQRADLAAESARVDASAQGVKVANAGWWPTVSLSAGYNTAYTSATGLSILDQFNQQRGGSISIGVSIPIFDRGQTSVNEQKAKIQEDNARLALEAQKQEVALEVKRAYLNFQSAGEQLAAAQAQQTASDLAVTTSEQRYKAGAGTLVELTQARTAQVQAASAVVSARYGLVFQQALMSYYTGELDPAHVMLNG